MGRDKEIIERRVYKFTDWISEVGGFAKAV